MRPLLQEPPLPNPTNVFEREGQPRLMSDTALRRAGDEEAPAEYTLRRSCAQALDCLAVDLADELLPHVLPIVERFLSDTDWRLREAAVLALGAVADGCMEGLRPHAHSVLKLLMQKTSDPQPNVRCNACWAVGRFAAFAVQAAAEGDGTGDSAAAAIQEIISTLVKRMQVRPVFNCTCPSSPPGHPRCLCLLGELEVAFRADTVHAGSIDSNGAAGVWYKLEPGVV